MFGGQRSVRLLADISQRLHRNSSFHCQQVRGIRIGNAEIPSEKPLRFALQQIHGIGRQRARQILADLSIVNKLTRELTGFELNSLREEVNKYLIGEDLKRTVHQDVQKMIDMKSYKGIRHMDSLPCRGQRTSTNARTRKEHRTR